MQKGVIAIAGVVGVGKSTILKLLSNYFISKGLKIRRTYIRNNHIFAYLITKSLVAHLKNNENIGEIAKIYKYNRELFRKIFRLWNLLNLVSIIIKWLICVLLPLKILRKHYIIVEDYLLTTIVDLIHIAKTFKISLRNISIPINILMRLYTSIPTVTILLDASMSELVKRWLARGTYQRDVLYLQDPNRYLRTLQRLLPFLAQKLNVEFIIVNTDGLKPVQTLEKVLEALFHE